MTASQDTQTKGETLAEGFSPLLLQAQRLAATLSWGEHGRRRSGAGDAFWQFRNARPGDAQSGIDWRRSAKSDEQFIRETEWQVAQTLQIWVDPSAAMTFTSGGPSKAQMGATLALASAILANRAGERVGPTGMSIMPKTGAAQLQKLAQFWSTPDPDLDFGTPDPSGLRAGSQAMLLSDFMGNLAGVETFLQSAARQSCQGVAIMVLDPQEVEFPFAGRTVFQSMTGTLEFESNKATSLQQKYQSALRERQSYLKALCDNAGWHFHVYETNTPAHDTMIWICRILGGMK